MSVQHSLWSVGSRRLVVVAAVAAATAVALSGCGRDYATTQGGQSPVVVSSPADTDGFHGVALASPIDMPDAVLTDTAGRPYDLRAETSGRVTLVYAGYTHCPDVCPTTVADLAAALRGLPADLAEQVDVLMLSTDPERDTPRRLRAWLDQFDPSYEGLTGPVEEMAATAQAMGIDVQPPQTNSDGSVTVEHGAQVLAFTPAGHQAVLLWTSGTTPIEYREDLVTLLTDTP